MNKPVWERESGRNIRRRILLALLLFPPVVCYILTSVYLVYNTIAKVTYTQSLREAEKYGMLNCLCHGWALKVLTRIQTDSVPSLTAHGTLVKAETSSSERAVSLSINTIYWNDHLLIMSLIVKWCRQFFLFKWVNVWLDSFFDHFMNFGNRWKSKRVTKCKVNLNKNSL